MPTDKRPAYLLPDTKEALETLIHLTTQIDAAVLRERLYSSRTTRKSRVRTLEAYAVRLQSFLPDEKCILFAESWAIKGTGSRYCVRIFLLEDKTWAVQHFENDERNIKESHCERLETDQLLSDLERVNFRGKTAIKNFRSLLRIVSTRKQWSESWLILSAQIDEYF